MNLLLFDRTDEVLCEPREYFASIWSIHRRSVDIEFCGDVFIQSVDSFLQKSSSVEMTNLRHGIDFEDIR